MNMLVQFSRLGRMRYCSHLDLLRCAQRTMRRAALPMRYSEGFNPHPILTFAQALSVGLETRGDYFTISFTQDVAPQEFLTRFNEHAPEGFTATAVREMAKGEKSPMASVEAALYGVTVREEDLALLHEGIGKLAQMPSCFRIVRDKTKDIRPLILQMRCDQDGALCLVSCGNENLSHKVIAETLSELSGIARDDIEIIRENLLTKIGPDAYVSLFDAYKSIDGR
jgi:radical SAM-linked protein